MLRWLYDPAGSGQTLSRILRDCTMPHCFIGVGKVANWGEGVGRILAIIGLSTGYFTGSAHCACFPGGDSCGGDSGDGGAQIVVGVHRTDILDCLLTQGFLLRAWGFYNRPSLQGARNPFPIQLHK